MKKKNDSIMQITAMNMSMNMSKLLGKKKQGENALNIRMKSIRDEMKRKLNEKLKDELSRLRSLFYEETRMHLV